MLFRKIYYKSNAQGFTLVEITIVIAILALLAAIAIPGLLRARLTSNESVAQATLKTISNACENFAAQNFGQYPTAIEDLTGAVPPFLNENYTAATRYGYNFACETLDVTNYSCTATPARCNETGSRTFTIITGGIITSVDCT
jgi:prepilin-type N-terminal cleavage/methylation domain-containing protein